MSNKQQLLIGLALIVMSTLGISSCSVFTHSKYETQTDFNPNKTDSFENILKTQPAYKLYSFKFSNDHQITEKNLRQTLDDSNVLLKSLKKLATDYPNLTIALLNDFDGLDTPKELARGLEKIMIRSPQHDIELIKITSALYPIQSYRVLAELADLNPARTPIIKQFLKKEKHLATLIFPRKERLAEKYRVTPLINSLSVTLYNKRADEKLRVVLNDTRTNQQIDAPLYYEPIQGAFSGSVFNLAANTEYNIYILDDRLKKSDNTDDAESKIHAQFLSTAKTRQNKPPINRSNIIKLRDIYTGGPLNIEALNINGTPGAWTKIDGTGVVIKSSDYAAINIGSGSYLYFENITVEGGNRHGIISKNAHHLWFNGCNISKWGRKAERLRGGIAYASADAKHPINYDAAFALDKTGVVTIENCEVHSPNGTANSWKFGHPKGPTAMLVSANHNNDEFDGQYIVRNNRFYGTQYKRFNDVIEGRYNGRVWGGFVRDSVIHNNYFAYANDDGIEIDGGQQNVAVFENTISKTLTGVSAIPNMLGPSYIFSNTIQNLGDQRGKGYMAVKLGGLLARPAGMVIIENNVIDKGKKPHSKASFSGDKHFWVYQK